jgi:NADH dehydrogenase (ubiquinone) 1 alpha subcomplex subunit 6
MYTYAKPVNAGYSVTVADTKKAVLALYRRSLKSIPLITRIYRLPYDKEEMKERIKFNFLQNSHLTDPHLIDMVVLQGENNLEEVVHSFQTRSHVLHFFVDTDDRMDQCKFLFLSLTFLIF